MKRPKDISKADYQQVKQIAETITPCVSQLPPPLPNSSLTGVHNWRQAEGIMFFSPWQFFIAPPIDNVCLRGQVSMEDMAMACDLACVRNPNLKAFQYVADIGEDCKGAMFARVWDPRPEDPPVTVVCYTTSPAYQMPYETAHRLACRSFAYLIHRVKVDNLMSENYIRSLLGFLNET